MFGGMKNYKKMFIIALRMFHKNKIIILQPLGRDLKDDNFQLVKGIPVLKEQERFFADKCSLCA